jgi:hypothetical protein
LLPCPHDGRIDLATRCRVTWPTVHRVRYRRDPLSSFGA